MHASQKISPVFLDCHRNAQRAKKKRQRTADADKSPVRKSKGRGGRASKAKDDTSEKPVKEQLPSGLRYEPMTVALHEDEDFGEKLFFWNIPKNTMRHCIIQENKAMGSVLIRLQPTEDAAAADATPRKKQRKTKKTAPNYMEWEELRCDIGLVYYINKNLEVRLSDCSGDDE